MLYSVTVTVNVLKIALDEITNTLQTIKFSPLFFMEFINISVNNDILMQLYANLLPFNLLAPEFYI
jgi:hypothetical protein